jgi:hypothetical protein
MGPNRKVKVRSRDTTASHFCVRRLRSAGLLETLCDPHLDDRLPSDPETLSLTVERRGRSALDRKVSHEDQPFSFRGLGASHDKQEDAQQQR